MPVVVAYGTKSTSRWCQICYYSRVVECNNVHEREREANMNLMVQLALMNQYHMKWSYSLLEWRFFFLNDHNGTPFTMLTIIPRIVKQIFGV
jgi:hypothetical protein